MGSILGDALALGGACLSLSSAASLSNLFMLYIDVIILGIFLMILTLWVMLVPKPDSYYESIKKYELQEHHKTEENMANEKS